MTRFVFVALLFLMPFFQIGNAATAVAAEPKEYNWVNAIVTAHEQSLKLYKEKRDARGAIRILEEHGVKNLLTNKPEEMAGSVYVTILNNFGFYLSETEDRYAEAEGVLKKVIELSPERDVVYLNLGDVYLKMSKKSKDNLKYKDLSKIHYSKYVEILGKRSSRIMEYGLCMGLWGQT
jgi:tetratricopeptide (TPR) repeat protein